MKDYGLMIVDKPVGPTSHSVVNLVRKGTQIRKVGHAGTLDPRASGVLVLCLGAATRLSEYLSTSIKCYEATVRFGSSTRTFDSDGEVTRRTGLSPEMKQIAGLLPEFLGEIDQVPPPYSAIKIRGRKAYEMARAGEVVEMVPRRVTIHRLEAKDYKAPDLSLIVECSAGTYIRSLAHDLGERLGTGAHLTGLRRTKAGPFSLHDAIPLPKLEVAFITGKWEQHIRPAADALPGLPDVLVDADGVERLRFGHCIPRSVEAGGLAKAIGPSGELIAILEAVEETPDWHPRKVFMG